MIKFSLKPENILIGSDGFIKLADFGLSLELSNPRILKTIAGTSEYLAPEMLERKSYSI